MFLGLETLLFSNKNARFLYYRRNTQVSKSISKIRIFTQFRVPLLRIKNVKMIQSYSVLTLSQSSYIYIFFYTLNNLIIPNFLKYYYMHIE